MKNVAYLVGTSQDKREINRLMNSRPTFIHEDYIALCTVLLEYLYDMEVRHLSDFDWVLDEFIILMEEDLTERLRGLGTDIHPYLRDVRKAMRFFKVYLDRLGWIPLPKDVHISPCNGNSVMILRIYKPQLVR